MKQSQTGYTVDLTKYPDLPSKLFQGPKDIPSLKAAVGNLLIETQMKFLVIVDDVDRLSSPEIRELFRAIKAIGDLPNVIYLLGFDPSIVSKAFDNMYPERGLDYLEKMIQVSFDLPVPNSDGISRILTHGLDELFSTLQIQNFDNNNFSKLYNTGIRQLLTSPRRAVRLLNALCLTIPAVVGEVKMSEFIAIEACRLFLPEVYQVLRMSKAEFAGHTTIGFGGASDEKLRAFHNNWLGRFNEADQEWIKEFFTELFPKFNFALNTHGYESEHLPEWRRELRVCSPDIFDVYFRFAKPDDTISSAELREFLMQIGARTSHETLLKYITSKTVHDKNWLWNLIERLSDHVESDLSPESAEYLLLTLLRGWTQYVYVPGTSQKVMWLQDNSVLLSGLIAKLFKRVPKGRRKALLIECLSKEFPPEYMLRLIIRIAKNHGKFQGIHNKEERDELLEEDEFLEVSSLFCEQILNLIQNQLILDSSVLAKLINAFNELDKEKMPLIVLTARRSLIGSVALMSQGLRETLSYTSNKAEQRFVVDLETVGKFISPELLQPAAIAAEFDSAMDDRSKEIAKAFLTQVENPSEQPKDDW